MLTYIHVPSHVVSYGRIITLPKLPRGSQTQQALRFKLHRGWYIATPNTMSPIAISAIDLKNELNIHIHVHVYTCMCIYVQRIHVVMYKE